MTATGEPVHQVQQRLTRVARLHSATAARITAFPTFMMVSMGQGDPATLGLTTGLYSGSRLDQIAALDHLVAEAEEGAVAPLDGLRRLDEIRTMGPCYGPVQSFVGYSVLTLGLCLILQPAPRDVAAAAVLGGVVGLIRAIGDRWSALRVLVPVLAALTVAALCALTVQHDLTGPGLRAMVASLVVFLPGAVLTTAVLELAAGQIVSGASRLVAGIVQLAFLAFGIVAGIQLVRVPTSLAFQGSGGRLGDWAPWLGVAVFAAASSSPTRRRRGRSRACSSSSTRRGAARCSATSSSAPTSARSWAPS